MLINKKQVRTFFRRNTLRVGVVVYETLNTHLEKILLTAVERAKKNNRNTVLDQDI